MKIFILGLARSGRTTVSKALAEYESNYYISAMDWIRATFRPRLHKEDIVDYERSFSEYLSERIKLSPNLITENIENVIQTCHNNEVFIIDGLLDPQSFVKLFNFNQDIIVVLNRLDNDSDHIDQDSIALNVIRDYCYWLSSMNLLPKERWIEYNFRFSARGNEQVKKMGSRNIVYIVKSIENVIEHARLLFGAQSSDSI